MENKRWVKLHCRLLDNVELMHDNNAFIVFTKLLLIANSKGQIAKTGRDLAEDVNLNYSTLFKAIKRLEDYGQIIRVSKKRYTIIQIAKWSHYQAVSPQHLGNRLSNQDITDIKVVSGNRSGNHMVTTREPHGNHPTGVSRIKNKNKKGEPAKLGAGYAKFKKTGTTLRSKKVLSPSSNELTEHQIPTVITKRD